MNVTCTIRQGIPDSYVIIFLLIIFNHMLFLLKEDCAFFYYDEMLIESVTEWIKTFSYEPRCIWIETHLSRMLLFFCSCIKMVALGTTF